MPPRDALRRVDGRVLEPAALVVAGRVFGEAREELRRDGGLAGRFGAVDDEVAARRGVGLEVPGSKWSARTTHEEYAWGRG